MKPLETLARSLGLGEECKQGAELLSRRRLLFGGSLLAALASKTQAAPRPSTTTRLLVNRLTMGWTEAEQLLADTLGYHGYLEYHLNHTAIDDSAVNQMLAPYNYLTYMPFQLMDLPAWRATNQLVEGTLLRAIHSKRQLYARMVEFWTDHFNIDINKHKNPWIKLVDDRDVIRANALGTFPALLSASMHSASMSVYLDNFTSVAGNPNENYARELLELHTLGVHGGYIQQDVVEVARCLTGWGVWEGIGDQLKWTFRYDPIKHDDGPKVVLGQQIPAGGGINDGLTVLNILANHPSTAQFISRKLCARFWAEDPSQTLVDAVAATYIATGGDIKSMLRTLFTTLDPATAGPKYKRPFHLFVSALRATGGVFQGDPISGGSALRAELALNGHESFHWAPPDGYPDRFDFWVGSLLPRWNFAASVTAGSIQGTTIDVDAFLGSASTAQQIADRIDQAMFGGQMPTAEKDAIVNYLLPDLPPLSRKREALALAISSPAFQWY